MLRSRFLIAWLVAPWILAACVALAEDKPAAKAAPSDQKSDPFADAPLVQGKPTSSPSAVQPKTAEAAKGKPAAESKPAPKNETPLRTGQAAIEKILSEPTVLEFVETPLTDVIDYLKDHHRIEIQISGKSLDEVGIGNDSPITMNLKGVSLRAALNLMLRDMALTWTIRDEVLLITTPEDEESFLFTKVYDVSDLVVCRDKNDRLWDDYETLIDLIQTTVLPQSWDCVGGAGAIAGDSLGGSKVLVVNQTYKLHGEIAGLLAGIREMAKKDPDAEPPRRDKPQPESGRRCEAHPMTPQLTSNPAAGAGGQSHGGPQAHGRQEGPQARPMGGMGGGMF